MAKFYGGGNSLNLASSQSSWYVDANAGSNTNSGKEGFPLLDTEELARRIFPNQTRLMLTQDVTIYIAAGSYLNSFFGSGCALATGLQGFTLRIVCAKTVVANIILSAAINSLAPTIRGQITTLSGFFTSRKRIRITSGAYVGAVSYSTSLTSGLQTFISGLVIPEPTLFHAFAGVSPGDVCQEETPTVLLRRVEFDCGSYTRIIIENAQIVRATVNGDCSATPSGDAGGNVTFSACDAAGTFSVWQCNSGGANLFACRVTGATVFQGFGWLNWGSVNQGLMGISNGSMSSYGLTIDGGVLITNVEANFEFKANQGASRFTAEQSYNQTGTIEVQNGGNAFGFGACINVLTGGEFINAGRTPSFAEIWGTSNPYSLGFYCAPGGHLYQDGVNATGDQFLDNWKIPSTTNLKIAQTAYSYSKNARPDPNNNCGLLAASYI